MVSAIKIWGKEMIIEKSSSGGDYIVTEFEEIFGKGDLDRFLEDQNTWLAGIGISVQERSSICLPVFLPTTGINLTFHNLRFSPNLQWTISQQKQAARDISMCF